MSLPVEVESWKQKDKVRDGDSKSVVGLMALTWVGTVPAAALPLLVIP